MGAKEVTTAAGWRTELMKLLRQNAYRFDLWQVWSDYVELMAIAISNRFDLRKYEAREARYMQIIKPYSKEELARFCHAYSALVMAMDCAEFDDVLGSVFMELELGNKWKGQFFTPYHLCEMMGVISLGDGSHVREQIEQRGYFRFSDPCTGGGAMVIGMAQALHEAQINYQQSMYVTAQDLDVRAVHMSYVQLSLLHVPAVVIHGNTLTLEEIDRWHTPAHYMGLWDYKINHSKVGPVTVGETTTQEPPQLTLFPEAA